MDTSSKLWRFAEKTTPLFAVMIFLAILNATTSPEVPWAIIPISAMMISVLKTAFKVFMGDKSADDASQDTKASRKKPRDARTSEAQARLAQARAYKRQIDALINATGDSLRKDKLRELANQVSAWVKEIETMVERIEAFKRNEVIQNDLVTVPRAIEQLKAQLAAEADPYVRASLERTLAAREDQMQALQKLQRLTRQAEVQLENTIAALGAIYSKALAMQSTDRISDYSQLSAEVDEQSRMLKDRLEALEEIKLSRPQANLSDRLDAASHTGAS